MASNRPRWPRDVRNNRGKPLYEQTIYINFGHHIRSQRLSLNDAAFHLLFSGFRGARHNLRPLRAFVASRGHQIAREPMGQPDAWRTIRRRAAAVGIFAPIGNHSFRATGITAYLANGGALEHAQKMAAHESPRTTKLYDRTRERLTQDEVERIRL
jgi:integrase